MSKKRNRPTFYTSYYSTSYIKNEKNSKNFFSVCMGTVYGKQKCSNKRDTIDSWNERTDSSYKNDKKGV